MYINNIAFQTCANFSLFLMFLYDSIYEIIKTREEMAEVLFTVKEVRELTNGYRKNHVRLASSGM